MKSLYEITGDIKDFNTVLVNRGKLDAITKSLREDLDDPMDDWDHGYIACGRQVLNKLEELCK